MSYDMQYPSGMKKKGTLDPKKAIAKVKNDDGSISTVRTMSVNFGSGEVLIPTVHPDGYVMSDDEAIERYKETGEHFGIFDSPEEATMYGKALSKSHRRLIE